jgi:hypothetical protein
LANSAALRRARSVRSPSANACIRQMMRLTSHALCLVLVASPNTSAYLARKSGTGKRLSVASSFPTFSSIAFLLVRDSENVNHGGH